MKQTNTSSIRYQDRPYRPCVGIMLINQQGDIFGGQRLDNRAEAWQMPQGGIDEGEDVETACFREMREEIGTNKADILRLHPDWLNYDIPRPLADNLWSGAYRGQTQKWVALRFTGEDTDINIQTEDPEFISWQWLSPDELIQRAVPFKRDVYTNIMAEFKDLLISP
ncbi:MAG: RNA pyrophosphohydrolase [Candidatus Puniceispirillaceae bacterium]|jgi:putative (di)nucleoside polyphosphate hydrolase|nr:RNA pyrophosphohydrolase [Alphaproteobacteria bacterium]|tara:strand:- start:56 stop:556 length:501 start_codon:yes stop_codon:yes gene_type:complete